MDSLSGLPDVGFVTFSAWCSTCCVGAHVAAWRPWQRSSQADPPTVLLSRQGHVDATIEVLSSTTSDVVLLVWRRGDEQYHTFLKQDAADDTVKDLFKRRFWTVFPATMPIAASACGMSWLTDFSTVRQTLSLLLL